MLGQRRVFKNRQLYLEFSGLMYYLYCIGKILAVALPRRLSYFVAYVIANFQFYISKRDRDIVIYNLTPILEDRKRVWHCARRVFINFAYYLVDFFSFSKINEAFIKKHIKVDGLNNLDKLVKERKGAIIVSAHIGNYEFGAVMTSFLGYDLYIVALPHGDSRINNLFNRQRSIFNVKVISTGRTIKKCYQVLKDKKVIAFLGDRDFTQAKGEEVVIRGRTAILPKGPAFFALKTGSCIVPTLFVRENKYYYRFIFEESISPKIEDCPRDSKEIINEYSRILERYILKYPDQWYMFQKYWRE